MTSLLDLIDRMTPELRKAFLASIQDIKDNARLGQIEAAIRRGDITEAIQALGINQAAMRPVTAAIERAYETGGVFTAQQFKRPTGQAVFRFDVRNSRAEAWLRDYSSTAVTRITNEQLGSIRDILNRGMNAGINPRTMALDLIGRIDPVTGKRTGGVIGLNAQQEKYLSNARRELTELNPNYFTRELRDKRFDGTVRKAIESGKPLTQEQIDKLATRYSDNLLQWRGETIARDQSLTALNNAQDEATKQLVDSGAVEERDVTGEWDASGDARTRETHREMDGQQRPMGDPFVSPSGARMMFPGDSSLGAPADETINCRCVKRVRINWIARAKRLAPALPQ